MANANIFQQYLRAPRSVADYSADLDKQEAMDLQLGQARQARADDNALRQAARSFGADADANYRTLLQAGLPTQAMAYRKGAIENDAKRAEIAKNTAQTGNFTSEANARDFDVKVKKFGQAITDIASYQTPRQALQQLQAHMQAGDIDPQKAAIIAQQLQAANTPGAFAQWQVGMLRGMMSAKDALESQRLHFQTNNLGGQTVTQGLDPFSGAQVSQVSQQNTQSPDNAATQATAMRGQNMADARARDANDIQRSAARTQIITDPNLGVLAVDKGTGQYRPVTGGADGAPIPGENKVSAQKLAGQLNAGIQQARELIPKATASGAGALIDRGAAFVGASTPGADAAAQLDTLAGWLISNVPRMQGPQSDRDVLLYSQMAARVGDRTAPASQRLAALDTLEALQRKYAEVGGIKPTSANQPKRLRFDKNGKQLP